MRESIITPLSTNTVAEKRFKEIAIKAAARKMERYAYTIIRQRQLLAA